jgi:site-specific recombinase XerC
LGPAHVTAFVERHSQTSSRPTVKQWRATLRMLFAWMVIGEVNPANPAHIIRDPRHPQKKGKTYSHFTHTGGDWSLPTAA